MTRPPTLSPFLFFLLGLLFLLLASSRVSGLPEGDSSFVVFSSFPTFAPERESGPHAPTSAALRSGFEDKSGHDVTSDPQPGIPLTINLNEAARPSTEEDPNNGDDAPKTGMFLFNSLMKDHQTETTTAAEETSTLAASEYPNETTILSDTNEVPAAPTASHVNESPERAPSLHPSHITTHSKSPALTQASENHGQPDEARKIELQATEAPASSGSLASMLQRMKSSPRLSTETNRDTKEQKDSPRQMTLADRLKALQERRAARLGSQGKKGPSARRRGSNPPQHRESPIQRRHGQLSLGVSGDEATQRILSLTTESKHTFVEPPSEGDREGQLNAKEIHDMVGEEASLVHTSQPQTPPPAATSDAAIKLPLKKPQHLSHSERLRERLQELRERRLSSTTQRARYPHPGNPVRPRATPETKTETTTRRALISRNTTAALTATQQRRQQFYNRLRNRIFTTRTPSDPSTSAPIEKGSETASEAPVINLPPRRLTYLPTTKRPLTFREKIEEFRSRNRFIPASKRKQQTATSITTTTTSSTEPITTTQPPTTIRTTPALAVNLWPVTQEPEDNFLVTLPPTTESSEGSRRFQIRKMIDAMLTSKGLSSSTTTTEQVLSLLEEVTSRPSFTATESSFHALPKHSGTSRPTLSVLTAKDEKSSSESFLEDFLLSITESVDQPPTDRPPFIPARNPPKLFQHFPSLSEKLAESFPPKRSKYDPTSPPASRLLTPRPPTPDDESSAIDRGISTDDDLPPGTAKKTDIDATTATSDVEITVPSLISLPATDIEVDDILPTTQQPVTETSVQDQRVKTLITRLLAQGVITMSTPDSADPVTLGMENDQTTTAASDILPLTTEETSVPPSIFPSEDEKSEPRSTFVLPTISKHPQLTRGAPLRRVPVTFGSPFTDRPLVSSVRTTDTTAKFSEDDTIISEVSHITTPNDAFHQDDLLQTSLPVTETEDSTSPVAGDLGANEIDAINSKDNLQSLVRSFVHPSIRPELAAVNHVLGFSLTTQDETDPVEVNLEKPQTSGDEDIIYDDLAVSATEQVLITTSLRDEDLAPTPLNLDITSFSVSEPSLRIHSVTEATKISAPVAAGTQNSKAGMKDTALSTKKAGTFDNNDPSKAETPTTTSVTASSKPSTVRAPATTPPAPDAVDLQANRKTSEGKDSAVGSASVVAQEPLPPSLKTPQQRDGDKATVSLQQLLRQEASDKADGSLRHPSDASQGVSRAVLRERLHLLRLMKERQGGRPDHETSSERLRTTSESPSTTSKVSLSELIRKKTSGEVTESEVTPRPPISESTTTEETTEATAAPGPRPVVTTVGSKQTRTHVKSMTNDAMRRFLELNRHVLNALRAKKTASHTEAPPPPTSTLFSTTSTTRYSIPDLGLSPSGSDNEGDPPVITQVTPQAPVTTAATPNEPDQPHEGTKVRTSSLLRPVPQVPAISETPIGAIHNLQSASVSHTQSPDKDGTLNQIKDSEEPLPTRPVPTTVRSRIPPPFRARRPHPPTKFTSRPVQDSAEQQQQQQPGSPLLSTQFETVVESPQIVPTTFRPLFHPFSTTRAEDAPTPEITRPDKFNDDENVNVTGTTPGRQSSEVGTEKPNNDRFTTLATLLKRKHIPSTKFHQAKQKTTLVPSTTTEATPEDTTQLDEDTPAPVTHPDQEGTTVIPQLSNDAQQTPIPHGDQSQVNLTGSSLRPLPARATTSATEGMTAEHVPPPFNFLDTVVDFRTGFQGRPAGTFQPGTASFVTPSGVPLPLSVFGTPQVVFPTTTTIPVIQFEPTHIPTTLLIEGTPDSTDASDTTDDPSSFPTSPITFEVETEAPSSTSLSLDLDKVTTPLSFNFQLQRKPFSHSVGLPPLTSSAGATTDGTLTTGGDTLSGRPLHVPLFTTTVTPGFTPFTLGRNEAFSTDDEPFRPPLTEIPLVVTTPITTVTPQVILLALPVNGSLVASGLLPDTTSTSVPEEDTETPTPTTTSIDNERKNVHPSESVAPPPDLMHMITKGVTVTSTEGIIDRVPPIAASEPQSPPHPFLVPPPVNPTHLNFQAQQNLPQNIFQEGEELSARITSESLPQVVLAKHSLRGSEEKNLKSEAEQKQVVVDATRTPNLQAGHLNLSELRQLSQAGHVTDEGSQGHQTPSGSQEQHTGRQGFPAEPKILQQQNNRVTGGQQPLQDLQKHPTEQKIALSQHNTGIQHLSGEEHVGPSPQTTETQQSSGRGEATANQHTVGVLKAQIIPGQDNVNNQHTFQHVQAIPGQHTTVQIKEVKFGHHNTANKSATEQEQGQGRSNEESRNALELEQGTPIQHDTASQHTFVQGQTQHVHQEGQESAAQHATNQHPFEQGQGSRSQHTSVVQHATEQPHDTLNQHSPQRQFIQGQHNLQAQDIQGQHIPQTLVTQRHQNQGQIIQGQHNFHGQINEGHHSLPGEIIQGQHSLPGEVIQSQHSLPGEVILGQHNHEQVIQGQHNHEQVIQGQHNHEQRIQDQHNLKGQNIQDQHNQGLFIQGHQEQIIQSQHNSQGQNVQGLHNEEQTIQSQHNQGQIIQDHTEHGQIIHNQHNQGQVIQGQSTQGQAIQGHHNEGQVIQSQHNPQGQVIQGQHNEGQVIQSQHNPQGQIIQGQHNEGQIIQSPHNPQGQVIQGQHNDERFIQSQHNPQGQVIQSHHNPEEHAIQGEHNEGQIIPSQHNSQGQITQGEHNHGHTIQSQHNPQGQVIQGQHNQGTIIQGQIIQQEESQQDQHGDTRDEHTAPGEHHDIHGRAEQEQDVIQGQVSREQGVVSQGQVNQGQVNLGQVNHTQEAVIQGQVSQGNGDVIQVVNQGQVSHEQGVVIQGQVSQGNGDVIQVVNQGQVSHEEVVIQGRVSQERVSHRQEAVIQGQVNQGHVNHRQGAAIQGQVNQGHVNHRQEAVIQGQVNHRQGAAIQGQVNQGHVNHRQGAVIQGQVNQGHVNHRQGAVIRGQVSHSQGALIQGQEDSIQGHVSQEQGSRGRGDVIQDKFNNRRVNHGQGAETQGRVSHGQRDVIQGQAAPEQHSPPSHHTPQVATQEQHQQHQDANHGENERTRSHQVQVQESSRPQHSSRRGKFISVDAVHGAQRIASEKGSEEKRIVQNVHSSAGPIIRGQSVVQPSRVTQGEETRKKEQKQQQDQQHRQHSERGHVRLHHSERERSGGGVQANSRGHSSSSRVKQSKGQHSRDQKQKVQVESTQGIADTRSPAAPPRGPPAPDSSVGRFTNAAAGFLLGPADSFITDFTGPGDDLPAGGDEGHFLTTTLPAATKDFRKTISGAQDPDGDDIPGYAGSDYPIRTSIPVTTFTCTPAMANMMFADPDTSCQVYHMCGDHKKFSFLCPKGTLFNQDTSVCQWWYTVNCAQQTRRLAEMRGLAAG